MTPSEVNAYGQPVGPAVVGWNARVLPPRGILDGRYCRLEPLDPARHGDALRQAFADTTDASWTYLPYGPFESERQFWQWIDVAARGPDIFFVVVGRDNDFAQGLLALMRIDAANGSVEVGNIHFSDGLKHTRIATEAVYLIMHLVFDRLRYRRLEWKCNALNEPSCRAARRFGFRYEGLFRQAVVVKGRNRDTAWFSIIDSEWPQLKKAYETWLADENFTADGRQRTRLSTLNDPQHAR